MGVLRVKDGGIWRDVGVMGGPGKAAPTFGSPRLALYKTSATDYMTSWANHERPYVYGPPGHWAPSMPWPSIVTTNPFAGTLRIARGLVEQSFDGLGCEVSTATGPGTARLGVYSQKADGTPDVLLATTGTADTSTTGMKPLTLTPALPPGCYWFAYLVVTFTAGTFIRGFSGLTDYLLQPGPTPSIGGTTLNCWEQTGLGALPNPYSGTPAMQTGMPLIFVRFA